MFIALKNIFQFIIKEAYSNSLIVDQENPNDFEYGVAALFVTFFCACAVLLMPIWVPVFYLGKVFRPKGNANENQKD